MEERGAHGTGCWVVDRVGSKSGLTVDRVESKFESSQKSESGSDRVRDDVSMTSASGLTGSKTDRVGRRLGRAGDWVRLTLT